MGVPWKTVLGADCMRARFLKFFSFLFLASFFLSSCKITVNEGSQNAIDAIESEVYDSSSLEDLSSLTVEDDTGCLVFQTPANPDGTTLHYTLTVDIDGTDYTRELNSDQIIVIRNLTLGKHKVTCKAFKADNSLYAIGSSDAIFRSGETATLELILQRLPDPVDLTSITASYNGSYQEVYHIPSPNSFSITETYEDGTTVPGNPSNYEVVMPTSYIKKVGIIPVTIKNKNKPSITYVVDVLHKYNSNTTYHNPIINGSQSISLTQNTSGQSISVSIPEEPEEYVIYGTSTVVKDQVTYQWLKNGSAIIGATSSEYTVPTDTADTFKYKCKVTYTPDETYATSTTPYVTTSDDITVTINSTSNPTNVYTDWEELKNDIEAWTNTYSQTFKISSMNATDYIRVKGNVIIQPASNDTKIYRAYNFKSNFFTVEGSNASLTFAQTGQSLTFDGKTSDGTQVSATGPIIAASDGATVMLNNGITLQNNKSSRAGAAIRLERATLQMYGGLIQNNTFTGTSTSDGGGGIYITNSSDGSTLTGSITILGGTISGNTCMATSGGGIYAKDASIIMQGGSISGNTSSINKPSNMTSHGGGGVYLNNSTLSVSSPATITNNSAPNACGGGIFNTKVGAVTIYEGAVTGNTASGPTYGHQIFNTYAIGTEHYSEPLN